MNRNEMKWFYNLFIYFIAEGYFIYLFLKNNNIFIIPIILFFLFIIIQEIAIKTAHDNLGEKMRRASGILAILGFIGLIIYYYIDVINQYKNDSSSIFLLIAPLVLITILLLIILYAKANRNK